MFSFLESFFSSFSKDFTVFEQLRLGSMFNLQKTPGVFDALLA